VVVEDLPTDALMRMFDSLPSSFRLSVGYAARVIRIDAPARTVPIATTVVTGTVPPPAS
jgi:hypothetical protein